MISPKFPVETVKVSSREIQNLNAHLIEFVKFPFESLKVSIGNIPKWKSHLMIFPKFPIESSKVSSRKIQNLNAHLMAVDPSARSAAAHFDTPVRLPRIATPRPLAPL